MVRPVKQGKTERMSYSRINEVIEVPNLIEIQKNSYNWFLNEGIQQIFQEISPVTDSQNVWEIYFLDKEFDPTKPTCSLEECREKDREHRRNQLYPWAQFTHNTSFTRFVRRGKRKASCGKPSAHSFNGQINSRSPPSIWRRRDDRSRPSLRRPRGCWKDPTEHGQS